MALVFATRIVSVAADQQAQAARESKLAGADLEVSPALAQFFPVSMAEAILKNPAVEKVAPIYKYTPAEGDLALLGVDPARILTPYELIAGEDLQSPGNFEGPLIWLPDLWAAQNGLGVGQTVQLTLAGETYEYKVAGLLKARPFGMPTAWLPLPTLQAALGTPGAVNSILVRLKPGETARSAKATLAETLGAAYVVTGAQDPTLSDDPLVALTRVAFPFASVVVLLAAAYLVYNAFALTLTERKREIGQLRALGMTRGQVLAQTLTEAMLVAGAGSIAGLPLGLGLALALIRSVIGAEYDAAAAFPLGGAALAVGLGLLITFVATFTLAWQAGRVSPLAAMSGAGESQDVSGIRAYNLYERWGWAGALGLAILFGVTNTAVAAYLRQSEVGANGIFYTLIPLLIPPFIALLAIPAVMRGTLWLVALAFPRSVVARMAVGSIRKQQSRALLTAASFAISLMLVVAFAGLAAGFFAFSANKGGPLFAADFMLIRPGAFSPVPPGLDSDLAALRAEAQVLDYSATSLPGYDDGAYVAVLGMDYVRTHPQLARPVEGSLDEAERYIAAGPSLLLTELAARRHNLHVGDTVPIDTLEGPVTFTVALIHAGVIIIPHEYGPRYFGAYPVFFMISALPGRDPAALADRLKALSQKHHLQLVDDPAQWVSGVITQLYDAIFGLFVGLTSISGLVVSLNLVNLLVASVLERQRELGTLRALGLARGQVRALVVAEAGLLGLVGSLPGVLGALVISWTSVRLFDVWTESVYGPATEAPTLPWAVAGLTLLLGPAIAMLAALWPADRAAAVHPADAMRAEGATGFLPPAKHLGPVGLRGLIARMPLAAKLSLTTGLVIALTTAALTAVRVNYERRLLEENMRAIFARGLELMVGSTRSQLSAAVTELTPALVTDMLQQSGAQADSVSELFQGGSPYDFRLRYVFVTDNQHRVLLSNRAEYNNRVLTDTITLAGSASTVRYTAWTGERVFESAVAIENQAGRQLGYVVVGLSTEPVDNIVRDIVRGSVGMMAAALLVAVSLTVFLTRRALAPLSQIADAAHAVSRGDLTQRIPETRWDEVGRVARSFNDMVGGLNDRERMRDLFGRYLSREVGEAVLAGRVTLGGERKTITCLYVDMRGSTSFAEKYQPEEVLSALNEYFEVIILAVEAQGGIVNRFVGDEAVCIFGAPRDYRDHADRALQAAVAMRTGLAQLNRKREALHWPTLRFGMGLNSGEVVAGATGSEARQEYTVIGDAMNVGARVQALNKTFPEHDILLSEFTRAALTNEYSLIDLGPVELRGKSEPVRVYALAEAAEH